MPRARRGRTLGRPLAGQELAVALVDVARQERGGERVGAGDEDRRHTEHVRREPGRDERPDEVARRDEHLAPEVPALLLRRELVLEVHAGRARLDHRLHQLEGVERAAEAGLCIGDDRRDPVRCRSAPRRVDLVGSQQRVVDPPAPAPARCHRVQALVRVDVPGEVPVGRDLPAATGRSPGVPPSPSVPPGCRSARRARRRTARRAAAARDARRPARASVCSTWKRPRSRSTSASEYGRSIPAHRSCPFVAFPLISAASLCRIVVPIAFRILNIVQNPCNPLFPISACLGSKMATLSQHHRPEAPRNDVGTIVSVVLWRSSRRSSSSSPHSPSRRYARSGCGDRRSAQGARSAERSRPSRRRPRARSGTMSKFERSSKDLEQALERLRVSQTRLRVLTVGRGRACPGPRALDPGLRPGVAAPVPRVAAVDLGTTRPGSSSPTSRTVVSRTSSAG